VWRWGATHGIYFFRHAQQKQWNELQMSSRAHNMGLTESKGASGNQVVYFAASKVKCLYRLPVQVFPVVHRKYTKFKFPYIKCLSHTPMINIFHYSQHNKSTAFKLNTHIWSFHWCAIRNAFTSGENNAVSFIWTMVLLSFQVVIEQSYRHYKNVILQVIRLNNNPHRNVHLKSIHIEQ